MIKELETLQNKYLKCRDSERAEFFYKIRSKYNQQKNAINYNKYSDLLVKRAGFVIFLNKTCFNGLFRQNSNGGFNVPHGRYKNPGICDQENIKEVSRVLKGVEIVCADFEECRKYAKSGTLVYFDPPYRPLNNTSSFTAYTKNGFCDSEQMRLANLCKEFSRKGVYVLLSNSDPTNEDKKDSFFDDIYSDFNIRRVFANRMINCNADGRGRIRELLIANY